MLTKVIVTALCSIICVLIIKDKNPQMAFAVSIAAASVILAEALPVLGNVYRKLEGYLSVVHMNADMFRTLFKVVIISLATRLTADMCRDNGERAVGAKVELAGIAAGLFCAMPIVDKALAIIGAL